MAEIALSCNFLSSQEIILKWRDYSVCGYSADNSNVQILALILQFSEIMFLQLFYKTWMDFDLLGEKFLKFYILFKCQSVLSPLS